VKTQFGSWWHRLIRGGVVLTPLEQKLLVAFRENMPAAFQAPLDEQLNAINLAQRHVEWRGIHLYRLKGGKVAQNDLPSLPCKDGEIRLLSLRVRVTGAPEPFHVAFWAVHRFFFGFGTGESLKPVRTAESFTVEEVTHSWRSNIEA
jgi:hypothetical protein